MTTLYNRRDRKEIRHKLRKGMTKAETILWTVLKGSALGVKFRRQASIGPFVVDFYCPILKLAIEVDGPTHYETCEAETYDLKRSAFLRAKGTVLFRCTNNDVYENLSGVITGILDSVKRIQERSILKD